MKNKFKKGKDFINTHKKISITIIVFLLSLIVWFLFLRETYVDVDIKMLNESEFNEFKSNNRVNDYYDFLDYNEDEHLNFKYILIAAKNEEIIDLEILEYTIDEKYVPVNVNNKEFSLPTPPGTYLAIHVPVTGGIPMIKYNLNVDGVVIQMNANASGRYGSPGEIHTKVKGKQKFSTFLKRKFIDKFK